MSDTTYDPVECALLGWSRRGLLTFEKRDTMYDIVMRAAGDEVLTGRGEKEMRQEMDNPRGLLIVDHLRHINREYGDTIYGGVHSDRLQVYDDIAPTVRTVFSWSCDAVGYRLEFMINSTVPAREVRSVDDVNEAVRRGEYCWSIDLGRLVGTVVEPLFSVAVERERERNTVVDIQVSDHEDHEAYFGTKPVLEEFLQRYPEGTLIEPVSFITDFGYALRIIDDE